MSNRIHPTAIVDRAAELGDGVEIGPYAIIDGPVRIGDGTRILAAAQVLGETWIGRQNVIHMGAVIGHLPQHARFDPKTRSGTRIGDRNTIREYAQVHRAFKPEMQTVIGSDNFLMAGAHIAHDCVIGSFNTIANNALLAGHVHIEDRVVISGGVLVHQFVRIGKVAMIGGYSGTAQDVPPFMIVVGRARVVGPNIVGLRRMPGSTQDVRREVIDAYKTIYRSGLTFGDACRRLDETNPGPDVRHLIDFIRASKRGVCRGATRALMEAELYDGLREEEIEDEAQAE